MTKTNFDIISRQKAKRCEIRRILYFLALTANDFNCSWLHCFAF